MHCVIYYQSIIIIFSLLLSVNIRKKISAIISTKEQFKCAAEELHLQHFINFSFYFHIAKQFKNVVYLITASTKESMLE